VAAGTVPTFKIIDWTLSPLLCKDHGITELESKPGNDEMILK
jgi:hypothetical protein